MFLILLIGIFFLDYKVKNEMRNYLVTLDKVNQLSDTYILCLGMSTGNIESKKLDCDSLKKEMNEGFHILKNNYPYTNFYRAIVKN